MVGYEKALQPSKKSHRAFLKGGSALGASLTYINSGKNS